MKEKLERKKSMENLTDKDYITILDIFNLTNLFVKSDSFNRIEKDNNCYLVSTIRKIDMKDCLIDYKIYIFDNFLDINIDYHDNYPSKITFMPIVSKNELHIAQINDGEIKFIYDVDKKFISFKTDIYMINNKTSIKNVEFMIKKKKK